MSDNWELVVGLEVHVQLRTQTKIFCACSTKFGASPNSQSCPVCLGLPGCLPVLNKEAVALAVRAAVALDCEVHSKSVFARKHYFYPDLPKGYQISQFDMPLATHGCIVIPSSLGGEARIGITRLHMEEDAGKSVHDRFPRFTAIDLNRAGTPLAEIVSEPDIRSASDAVKYLRTLKQIMEYTQVSDANMEEGSLRADVNISVRKRGDSSLGIKTEIKNLNTFSGIERAIEMEFARHCTVLESGGEIVQQTMLWDGARNEIRPARTKEESHDYRYLPDPDLPVLIVSDEQIGSTRQSLPELPARRRERLMADFGLTELEADQVVATKEFADYTESVIAACVTGERDTNASGNGRRAVNWMLGAITASLNTNGIDIDNYVLPPKRLAELIGLEANGTISNAAARTLLPFVEDEPNVECVELAKREGLLRVSDETQLDAWVSEILESHPDEATRFLAGERRLQGVLVGLVMKRSGGSADPRMVNQLLVKRLPSS